MLLAEMKNLKHERVGVRLHGEKIYLVRPTVLYHGDGILDVNSVCQESKAKFTRLFGDHATFRLCDVELEDG